MASFQEALEKRVKRFSDQGHVPDVKLPSKALGRDPMGAGLANMDVGSDRTSLHVPQTESYPLSSYLFPPGFPQIFILGRLDAILATPCRAKSSSSSSSFSFSSSPSSFYSILLFLLLTPQVLSCRQGPGQRTNNPARVRRPHLLNAGQRKST
eukprot:926525-Pelagomonas_calceolata.AAC.1